MFLSVEKKKVLQLLILCVCFLVIFFHATYFMSQKEGAFLDETMSFYLANNEAVTFSDIVAMIKNKSFDEYMNNREPLNGIGSWKNYDEVLSKYTVLESERFEYTSTYLFQASDVHPPFYYFVVKTVCSLFPHMSLMMVGFIINIFFLMLTCILIYKIGGILFENRLLSIAVMLYYGLSYSFINNVTYFRMYAMLTFWMTLCIYINIKWYISGFKMDRKILIKLCVAEYFAMLTQYFALFFCFPIFALNVYIMRSENKKIGRYVKYNIITGMIYLITWTFSIEHVLFSNRGSDVASNFSSFKYVHKLLDYNPVLSKSIFAYSDKLYYLIVLIFFAVIIGKIIKRTSNHMSISFKENEHIGVLLYLFVAAFFYYSLAAIASPWTSDRYITASIPSLCIIVTYVLSEMVSLVMKNRNIIGIAMMLFGIALCVRWHHKLPPEYLYNSPERVEYKNTCNEYDGIIIDKKNDELYAEIELNFAHPRCYRTNDDNIDKLENDLNKNTSYMAYINKYADIDEIIAKINDLGYTTQKLDLETDFYAIYKLN